MKIKCRAEKQKKPLKLTEETPEHLEQRITQSDAETIRIFMEWLERQE